jgi:hypothetical protein
MARGRVGLDIVPRHRVAIGVHVAGGYTQGAGWEDVIGVARRGAIVQGWVSVGYAP